MYQFYVNEQRTARVRMHNPTTKAFTYAARLSLGSPEAVAAEAAFFLAADGDEVVSFPLTMPALAGSYPLAIAVSADGREIRAHAFDPVTVIEEADMYIEAVSPATLPLLRGEWSAWDISGYVPVGTKAVQLYVYSGSAGNNSILNWGARRYGSANNLIFGPTSGYSWVGVNTTIWCEVVPERLIEIYRAHDYLGNQAMMYYRIIGALI